MLGQLFAYCHSVGAFGWTVVGSVAGVVGAAAAVVFGLPLLRGRKKVPHLARPRTERCPPVPVRMPRSWSGIPQEPLGFRPRADLLAALDAPGPRSRMVVVHAVTGMRGVGETHLAAAYARAKLAERWRLVAWINAEDLGGVLAGLAAVAAGLGLGAGKEDAEAAGRAVRHRLKVDGGRCPVVFDNATDPAVLQPFLPAAGEVGVTTDLPSELPPDLRAFQRVRQPGPGKVRRPGRYHLSLGGQPAQPCAVQDAGAVPLEVAAPGPLGRFRHPADRGAFVVPRRHLVSEPPEASAARPASRRAIGTRNGEQDT